MRVVIAALAAALLAACAMPRAPADVEAASDRAFAQLNSGDMAGLQQSLSPELRGEEAIRQIALMKAQLPTTKYTGARTLQWKVTVSTSGPAQADIVREYAYPDKVAQWDMVMTRDKEGQPWLIRGLHVQVADQKAIAANSFELKNRSPLHYAVLGGAILSPLICLFALVQVIRSPKFPWKWAFALLSLIGVGQFSLDWTTGQAAFQPIYVLLLSAGFLKGPGMFDHWVISVALPLGAIISLRRVSHMPRQWAVTRRRTF